jgi:hypothetical protein
MATATAIDPAPAVRQGRRSDAAAAPRAGRTATWLAALLAAASLPLHAWMLADHPHGLLLTALMAAMALGCLWCAVNAVRSLAFPAVAPAARPPCSRGSSVRHLWAMALSMALLHVALLTGFPVSPGAHHHGSAATGGHLAAGVETGTPLMLVIIALELAVCFACAAALRARHPASRRGQRRSSAR